MVKPEFWTDEKLTECSMSARLLFIGIWNFSDDLGNIELSPKQIKMLIFPSDDVRVEPFIDELLGVGVLSAYSVNGNIYANVKNFLKHQKINRPSTPRCPPFSQELELKEYSLSTHAEVKGSEVKRSNTKPIIKKSRKKIDYTQEFQSFWNEYPRSVGKGEAFTEWCKIVSDEYPADDVINAAINYTKECRKQGREESKIRHACRFLKHDFWKDYCFEEEIS